MHDSFRSTVSAARARTKRPSHGALRRPLMGFPPLPARCHTNASHRARSRFVETTHRALTGAYVTARVVLIAHAWEKDETRPLLGSRRVHPRARSGARRGAAARL